MGRLFVYGTLAPGRPNDHVLRPLGGTWEPATVRGRLRPGGWGSALGYPGIDLDDAADEVQGLLFTSAQLDSSWDELDAFEGDGYERVPTRATLADGREVEAFVYRLREPGARADRP